MQNWQQKHSSHLASAGQQEGRHTAGRQQANKMFCDLFSFAVESIHEITDRELLLRET